MKIFIHVHCIYMYNILVSSSNLTDIQLSMYALSHPSEWHGNCCCHWHCARIKSISWTEGNQGIILKRFPGIGIPGVMADDALFCIDADVNHHHVMILDQRC